MNGQIIDPAAMPFITTHGRTNEGAIFSFANEKQFTRIPVYKDTPDEVTGYVTLHELASAKTQEQPGKKLSELAKPVVFGKRLIFRCDGRESATKIASRKSFCG